LHGQRLFVHVPALVRLKRFDPTRTRALASNGAQMKTLNHPKPNGTGSH
jgi:hypothetical protein